MYSIIRSSLRVAAYLALVAGAATLTPERVAAQVCVDCSLCSINQEMGNKAFEGDDSSVHDVGEGTHSRCITSGGCSDQHPVVCIPEEEQEEQQEELLALIDRMTFAVAQGEAEAAYHIATTPGLATGVYYSSERHAIQALGCDGLVIAHIPLGAWRHGTVASSDPGDS